MWFASHLYDQGRISAEQFVDAVQTQLANKPLIGRLAIHANLLDEHDLERILAAQRQYPDQTFSKLAEELGLLTRNEVAELLLEQAEATPTLQTILVDSNLLSWRELPDALRSARRRFAAPDLQTLCQDGHVQ